jgi:hypothetical protein
MSAYEELRDKITTMVREYDPDEDVGTYVAADILALVLRTLEDAAEMEHTPPARTILDWLASSPLEPPK